VGRGAEQSYCILVSGKMSDAGRERIRTMVDSNDGFEIAEVDLKLRGPGEFFGTRQSGLPGLHFANLVRDQDILEMARDEAQRLIETGEPAEEYEAGVRWVERNWRRRYGLVEAG
jgi:ATP-dependent DNA helicase RecG